MNRSLVVALLALAQAATPAPVSASGPEDPGWIFPGEYESHQAMWMLWPAYENKAGFPSQEPITEMIRAMHGKVQVNLAVQDEAEEEAVREELTAAGVALDHVNFFPIPHLDIWARDMGPQFTRSRDGRLRINDWNFNYWGNEEPDSEFSTFEEPFDRTVASAIGVPTLDARPGPQTGVRFIHEGGSATHNGHGTMVVVESVVMQRNLGPGRFCGGAPLVTDFTQPNTYAPHPDWPACRRLVEREYRRMLGVKKLLWIPTGLIEDTGTFRGALGKHIQVPEWDGVAIPHAGVYTLFPTNGHPDQFLRFVSPDTVLLAEEVVPSTPAATPAEKLVRWLQERNRERMERAREILARETNESGRRLRVLRIPTAPLTFEVFGPGDGTYDYYAAYDRWEDGSTLPEVMLAVWPAGYVNYVPTNDLVLVPRFWRPGRGREYRERDDEALEVLRRAFPGRDLAQVRIENVVRGGGGMNCITQQQPASARFARTCGWAKVKVDAGSTRLFATSGCGTVLGTVPRLTGAGRDLYLERLREEEGRVKVRVHGPVPLAGRVGWVEASDVESAGEKCPAAYSPN